MATAEEYLAEGFNEYRDLVAKISTLSHIHERTIRSWLARPLPRIAPILIFQNYIVLPEDRKWVRLYHDDLAPFFSAYLQWIHTRYRTSTIAIVEFYNGYMADEEWALAYLPRRSVSAPLKKGSSKKRHLKAI